MALVNSIAAGMISAQTPASDAEVVVRRVANYVLRQTTHRLVDTATGQTYEHSEDLPVKETIVIESRFNQWMYPNYLVLEGLKRLNDPRYAAHVEACLDFVARHVDYFRRQRAAGIRPNEIMTQDRRLAGYLELAKFHQTGFAPLWIARAIRTKLPVYQEFVGRFAALLDNSPRLPNGLRANTELSVLTDDVYLTVPGLCALGRLDDAVNQTVGAHRLLFHSATGLYRHAFNGADKTFFETAWGRGNGWMALAHVELLARLPADHPRRGEVLANFRAQMAGVRRWQDPAGGWHQVLDHPESWIETSGTGMFVYALARGVNEGWLDRSFLADAQRGWQALAGKADATGVVTDACRSTRPGDLAFYLARAHPPDDPHGYGPFLLAGAEILRISKGKQKE